MTCKFIKKVVEKESGVYDLSIQSRKGSLPTYRFVYFKLCRKFMPKTSLQKIANGVGLRNHATVISGLKKYEELEGSKYLRIYEKCFNSLLFGFEEEDDITDFDCVEEVVKYYRIRAILTSSKYHNVINKLQERILILNKKNNDFYR